MLTIIVGVGNPFACDGDSAILAAEAAPARLTHAQRREATQAVTQFRRARGEPQKQAEIIREAIAAGPHVARALFGVVGQQLQPHLVQYRDRFRQAAASLANQKLAEADMAEVARLRGTVLSLRKDPDLTEKILIEKAAPAMKRLAEMLLVDRVDVIAGSKSLQADRHQIEAIGALWEQLAVCLANLLPKESKRDKPPSFGQYLQGEERTALNLAMPMGAAARNTLAENARLAPRIDPEETRAIGALNLTRSLLGLAPCAIDVKLCAAARDHSADMKKLDFFDHESPVAGKKTPWDRAERFGTSASAENIGVGYEDGRAANKGWFHSPVHHANMLGNYKRVGIGRSGDHYTEMFGD